MPMVLLVTGAAANADGGSNAPAALKWMDLKDSDGTSIWNYELSLDRGGVTNAGKVIWSFVTDLLWGLYLMGMAVAIWIIDFALSFEWLKIFVCTIGKCV